VLISLVDCFTVFSAPKGKMINARRIGKNLNGNCAGVIKVPYRHLPGGTEGNY
jgi:hypothetical protein